MKKFLIYSLIFGVGIFVGVFSTLLNIKNSNYKIRPIRFVDTKSISEIKLHTKYNIGDTVSFKILTGKPGGFYNERFVKAIILE